MSGLRRHGKRGDDEGRAAGTRGEGMGRHFAERVAAEERRGGGGDAQRIHGTMLCVLREKVILFRS